MPYQVEDAKSHIEDCKFATHCNVDSFYRACLLAVGSIRIHSKTFWLSYLNPIQEKLEEGLSLEEIHDNHVPFMPMKPKRNALKFLTENKELLWDKMLEMNGDEFHDYLCKTVPGVGPVKAGFIVQMCYGELGCIDNVNLKRLGIKTTSSTPHVYRKQLNEIGETSAEMWFKWCATVATRGNDVKSDKLNWSACGLSKAHALFVRHGSYDPQIIAK